MSAQISPVAFVDSSAILALVDRDDLTHPAAVEAYQSLKADGYRLFTTNHIISETYELIDSCIGGDIAREWLREMALPVYVVEAADLDAARDMVIDAGKSVSFTDAVSVTVMKRLGVTDAFAVDPDFLAALD